MKERINEQTIFVIRVWKKNAPAQKWENWLKLDLFGPNPQGEGLLNLKKPKTQNIYKDTLRGILRIGFLLYIFYCIYVFFDGISLAA
jgi:hypothetical protein